MSHYLNKITSDIFRSLPCFEFKEEAGGRTIRQQILETFSKPQYKDVAKCLAQYGKVRSEGGPSMARGVARLCKHFDDMANKFYGNTHVFEVILDKVQVSGGDGSDSSDTVVKNIINELQKEIPRR